ncbi:unnamed protein product [Protopolystoma xenopodis]|uniref:Uncharacterized protein n=1 Tax=Protopolystoma xenopodis TaxID=117903 RepID=A0A448WNA2_9PLAT|nr:unnamed protein product [Protopolystoma xenopodis]
MLVEFVPHSHRVRCVGAVSCQVDEARAVTPIGRITIATGIGISIIISSSSSSSSISEGLMADLWGWVGSQPNNNAVSEVVLTGGPIQSRQSWRQPIRPQLSSQLD